MASKHNTVFLFPDFDMFTVIKYFHLDETLLLKIQSF